MRNSDKLAQAPAGRDNQFMLRGSYATYGTLSLMTA